MADSDRAGLIHSLENRSIPELEALLQQDFIASDGDIADPNYVMAIVEVIQKKEAAQPDYQPVDTKKAWEDFQTFYNTEERRLYPLYPSGLPDEMKCTAPAPNTVKRRNVIRRTLLIAASLALMIALTAVPVFGYSNVIQMVAHLANGTFRFDPDSPGNDGGISIVQPDGTYESLPQALEAYGIYEQVFPKNLESGFEQIELNVDESPFTHHIEFYAYYKTSNQDVSFTVIVHDDSESGIYETSLDDAAAYEVYSVNETDFHIFDNAGITNIVWYVKNIECCIVGDLSHSEARQIVDSIY